MGFANTTCPDIASAVRTVACFPQDPSVQHWNKAVLRILEYLKGTRDLGLTFSRDGGDVLKLQRGFDLRERQEFSKIFVGWSCVVRGNSGSLDVTDSDALPLRLARPNTSALRRPRRT